MDAATQARIAEAFFELERAGTTLLAAAPRELDPTVYTSTERFEAEQRELFRRSPVVIATAADLPRPGAYVTVESGGIPIVAVRAPDGTVRAYVNACRHRAHPVASGCGDAGRRVVCPFHSWSYDVGDGRLVAQPRSLGGFDTLDATSFGLLPVPCVEAHGLVIVRPEGGETIDAEAFLAGIGDELDPFGIGSYHVFSRTESEWNCNWKLLVDTFTESYHVAALHGASLGDQPGHRMYYEPFGDHLRIPVPGPTLYDQRDKPPAERRLIGHATVQHHLHPNVFLNHVFDYFVMWRFVPLAVDRTRALLTRYWPGPIDDALRAKLDRRFAWQAKLTLEEDYPASEKIHRALASGRVATTVLGRNEGAAIRFHESIERRLAAGSTPR